MKEIQYEKFSLMTHNRNWRTSNPNVCQFELTFKCGLRCKHCYTDCYNKPGCIKDELDTKQIKAILDKIYDAGVLWVCFTGGDPLTRNDFLEIYAYAKNKGFIVTIFTNAYSMTARIADYLRKSPPFVIEITVNAVDKGQYERITRVKGSFDKAMKGIGLIIRRKLPLKIKTQVTKDNVRELPAIKKFVEARGLNFFPSPYLHARLDKNVTPCSLRINPGEVISYEKNLLNAGEKSPDDDCQQAESSSRQKPDARFFSCAIDGGDGLYLDPYGNVIPCGCIREPRINLCRMGLKEARRDILSWVRSRAFTTDSPCKACRMKAGCIRCPGKALVEKGDMEAKIEWFCELAAFRQGRD